jgi:hypothetical protein
MSNVRYRSEFYSDNTVFWRVDILDMANTYTTPTDFTCGSSFFSANYAGSKERFDPVVGSKCTIPALIQNSTDEALITDIIGSAEQRFFCKIYKASSGSLAYDQANCTIWWMGVLLQDLGKFEDIYYPYEYEISFTDGLAALKDIDYINIYGGLLVGRITFLNLIIDLLTRTGLMPLFASGDVFLKTCVHWYDVHQHFYNNADPLAYADISQETFYKNAVNPSKCLDILQMILQTWGARIVMADGIFHIIQVNELANTTLITRSYNKSGTQLSYNTADNYQSSVFNILAGGSTTFFPALNQVTKNYEYQQAINGDNLLPVQNSYESFVPLLGEILAGYNYNLFFSGNVMEVFAYSTMPQPFQIQYTLSLVLDLGAGASPRYYSLDNGTNGQGPFTWIADNGHICTFWSGMFTLSPFGVFSYLNINFMTPPPPGSGTGKFLFAWDGLFYNQYFNPIAITGATITYLCQNFNLLELNSNLDPTSGKILFSAINSAIATEVLQIPDTLIGDASSFIDIGRIMTSDGSTWANSSSWNIKDGSQASLITQLMVNEVLKGQQTPCARVTHSIISKVYSAQRVFVFTDGLYQLLSATFTANNDTWQGEWFKMNLLSSELKIELIIEAATTTVNKNKLSFLDSSSIVNIINNPSLSILSQLGVNANTTLTDFIPAGYKLLSIDTYSVSLVTVSIGTTPGGDDVMSGVDCNGSYSSETNKWSKLAPLTLYITAASWPAAVDFYFSIQKIT